MVEHLQLLVITNFTLVATLLNTLVWTNLAYHSSKSISPLVVTQLPKLNLGFHSPSQSSKENVNGMDWGQVEHPRTCTLNSLFE